MPRSLTLLLLALCLLLAPGLATASTCSTPHVATIRDTEVEAQHLYDPDGRVLARLQSPAADTRPLLQELYIYAGGQLLGFLDFSSGWSNGRPFWVHTDLQGSLRLVTDASGEAMQELRWSPMGTLLSTSAPMLQDALAFAWQPLAYRGVPVVDVGARVRHAEYGWFLSPDPVAWGEPSDPQTFHRSQYARGNPMTYVDPWGEAPAFVYATQAASMIVASAPERMQRTDSVAGASAWAAVALAGAAYQDLANAPLDQQVVLGLVTGGGLGLVRSKLARVGAREGGAIVGRGSDVTVDAVRRVMRDAPLTSQQRGGVNLPKIQEYVDRYLAGEVPPPILVDKGMIVDGNHRYIAGRVAGKEVPTQDWLGGRPESAVPWDDIPIDLEPWKW